MDENLYERYKTLTELEIKDLIVDKKWMATVKQTIQVEMSQISQKLTKRIKELAGQYEKPLPELASETEALVSKVEAHLNRMGFTW